MSFRNLVKNAKPKKDVLTAYEIEAAMADLFAWAIPPSEMPDRYLITTTRLDVGARLYVGGDRVRILDCYRHPGLPDHWLSTARRDDPVDE